MRILLLISSFGSGGAERVAATLCDAWAARGDEVTLVPTFSGGGKSFYTLDQSVRVIYLADLVGTRGRTLSGYAQRLFALRALISGQSPDVVVSFLPNVNVAAIVASAFTNIPVIICERTDPSCYPPPGWWMPLCRTCYRFADMLTVQTEQVASKIAAIYPGLERVRTIPNPLPAAIADVRRHNERDEKGRQRKVLLSLGRLSPEKQVDQLLYAFEQVAPAFDDWDLHIYGEGPQQAALEKQIRLLGLSGRAILKGATATPWKAMADADVFAMPSRFEGFPNALLEAMGVGLPCIATDCPSGPLEITRNGRDALLVPVGDGAALVAALTNLMGDADLRVRLGMQARKSVFERYSLGAVPSHWDRLFREVGAIGEPSPA